MNAAPIGVPLGTRLICMERMRNDLGTKWWRLWIARSPCGRFGTFLDLFDNGLITNTTCREGEGDEIFIVRPFDSFAEREGPAYGEA